MVCYYIQTDGECKECFTATHIVAYQTEQQIPDQVTLKNE